MCLQTAANKQGAAAGRREGSSEGGRQGGRQAGFPAAPGTVAARGRTVWMEMMWYL